MRSSDVKGGIRVTNTRRADMVANFRSIPSGQIDRKNAALWVYSAANPIQFRKPIARLKKTYVTKKIKEM
jgi:hypothetical protein